MKIAPYPVQQALRFFSLIGLPLLLGGCLSMNITENIDETGNSSITIYQEADKAAVEEAEADGAEVTIESLCDNQQLLNTLTNTSCEENMDEYISQINGNRTISSDEFIKQENGSYVFKLKSLDTLLKAFEDGEDSDQLEVLETGLEEIQKWTAVLRNFGISANYTANFPFPIISSDLGSIDGNRLSIDLLSLDEALFLNPDIEVVFRSSEPFSENVIEKIQEVEPPETIIAEDLHESAPKNISFQEKLPSTGGKTLLIISILTLLIIGSTSILKKRA